MYPVFIYRTSQVDGWIYQSTRWKGNKRVTVLPPLITTIEFCQGRILYGILYGISMALIWSYCSTVVNPLYNDILNNSKILYNVNFICTKLLIYSEIGFLITANSVKHQLLGNQLRCCKESPLYNIWINRYTLKGSNSVIFIALHNRVNS